MCDHILQHPNYYQWLYVLLWWYKDIGYLPFSVKKMWYFILYAFLIKVTQTGEKPAFLSPNMLTLR